MKVSMGMDVAPNPNPPDIRVSMDIHGFTHYVHFILEHFGISATMEGRGSGGHGRGRFD
jgi:hypothetical protein